MNASVGSLIKGCPAGVSMLGSLVSSMSQRMVRMATMALMMSGAGMAGYSIYLDQYAPPGSEAGAFVTFFKDNARFFLILGAVGVVVGGLLNFLMMRRMQKRMMGGMGLGAMGRGGTGMSGGMPMMGMQSGAAGGLDPQTMLAMQGLAGGREVVKVRCKSCSSLEAEVAVFCSKCGKAMA